MNRHFFDSQGLRLSFLDAGGAKPALIALHAHWMEAGTFAPLASALPDYRLIALDQRGHGESAHAASYTRDDYLRDLDALFAHLRLDRAVLLGNSLGGVNAYQYAARRPERVRAMVVEEIGAVVNADLGFVASWSGTFPSREALEAAIGPRLAPWLRPSFRDVPGGVRLAFEPSEMIASQRETNGDHWADWLASRCPALLVRGSESRVTDATLFEEMARRRPNTTLVTLDGGHVLHAERPTEFVAALRAFLATVP